MDKQGRTASESRLDPMKLSAVLSNEVYVVSKAAQSSASEFVGELKANPGQYAGEIATGLGMGLALGWLGRGQGLRYFVGSTLGTGLAAGAAFDLLSPQRWQKVGQALLDTTKHEQKGLPGRKSLDKDSQVLAKEIAKPLIHSAFLATLTGGSMGLFRAGHHGFQLFQEHRARVGTRGLIPVLENKRNRFLTFLSGDETLKWYAKDDPLYTLYKKTDQSVVMIEDSLGHGTGFFVDKYGTIATARHCINDPFELTVRMSDGNTYSARLVNEFATHDLALIKLHGKDLPTQFKPLPVFCPANGLEYENAHIIRNSPTGKSMLAMGNFSKLYMAPGKYKHLAKPDWQDENWEDADRLLVNINARIRSGYSGGPVLNEKGVVTAVTQAGAGNHESFAATSMDLCRLLQANNRPLLPGYEQLSKAGKSLPFDRSLSVLGASKEMNYSARVDTIENLGLKLFGKGRLEDAQPVLEVAFLNKPAARTLDRHLDIGESLADVYIKQNLPAKAMYQYHQLIDLAEGNPKRISLYQEQLADLMYYSGRRNLARERYVKAALAKADAYSADHPDVARLMVKIADCDLFCMSTKKQAREKAEKTLLRAYQQHYEIMPENHQGLAQINTRLGQHFLHKSIQRFEDSQNGGALKLVEGLRHKRALKQAEENALKAEGYFVKGLRHNAKVEGLSKVTMAETIANLADAKAMLAHSRGEGGSSQAMNLRQAALIMAQRERGYLDAGLIPYLRSLAENNYSNANARGYHNRMIAIMEKAVGGKSHLLTDYLVDAAEYEINQGANARARQLLNRAYAIEHLHSGRRSPRTLEILELSKSIKSGRSSKR